MKESSQQERIISITESVCPECLARIAAFRVALQGDVYLKKECPQHGSFKTILWRGNPDYSTWVRPITPSYPEKPFRSVEKGCPYDCGLCPQHRQKPCCVLLEITQRCDLQCPFCFADAGTTSVEDPDLATIEMWYRRMWIVSEPCWRWKRTPRNQLPKPTRPWGFK
jgi:uncharacterized radical SAM superfamily Fe-S cluster-containing enzyme